MKVSVIGAGSFGTAVSWLLATQGHEVSLWARDRRVVDGVNESHVNPRYLSGTTLPQTLRATDDIACALEDAGGIVFASPSTVLREMGSRCASYIGADVPVIALAKGVEAHTSLLMVDVLEETIGNPRRIAALSGPSHAEEVVLGYPTSVVVAAREPRTSAFFQGLFSAPAFRIYTSEDVAGVELCGAAKNIMAIIVGASYGMGYGDNTAALIMTRGLAEISRLVCACGGDPLTCMGLAGMGDLVVTCTSQHSRNRRFGESLAQGGTLDQFHEKTHMVVEGAVACASICELADAHGVEMPLSDALRRVIYEHEDAAEMADLIMSRPETTEFYGMDEASANRKDA